VPDNVTSSPMMSGPKFSQPQFTVHVLSGLALGVMLESYHAHYGLDPEDPSAAA